MTDTNAVSPLNGVYAPVLRIHAWDMLSGFGGKSDFLQAWSSSEDPVGTRSIRTSARRIADFDVREALGKKGTRNFDRHTGLFVKTACNALEESGLKGGVLRAAAIINGTATGSLSSIQDFLLDTYRLEKPYFVNPAHMPNTVINCAAGQCAIWLDIKGPNATLSAGAQSFHAGLRLALRWARKGYARHFIVGAVEEITDITAKLGEIYGRETGREITIAEGVAVFVLEVVKLVDAESTDDLVLATRMSTALPGDTTAALGRLTRAILADLALPDEAIRIVATKSAAGTTGRVAEAAVADDLGAEAANATDVFGNCFSVSGAMQLALLLSALPPGGIGLAVSASRNGSLACTAVRKGAALT